jgi:hypothetical protein
MVGWIVFAILVVAGIVALEVAESWLVEVDGFRRTFLAGLVTTLAYFVLFHV